MAAPNITNTLGNPISTGVRPASAQPRKTITSVTPTLPATPTPAPTGMQAVDTKPLEAGTADLNNIGNIELQIGKALSLGPGQVTPGQSVTLAQMQQAGDSTWTQYYQQAGLTQFAANAQALVGEQALTHEALWNALDMQQGVKYLGLAGSAELEVIKEQMKKQSEIGGLLEIAAGAAMTFFLGWTGVGAVAGAGLMAAGANNLKGS